MTEPRAVTGSYHECLDAIFENFKADHISAQQALQQTLEQSRALDVKDTRRHAAVLYTDRIFAEAPAALSGVDKQKAIFAAHKVAVTANPLLMGATFLAEREIVRELYKAKKIDERTAISRFFKKMTRFEMHDGLRLGVLDDIRRIVLGENYQKPEKHPALSNLEAGNILARAQKLSFGPCTESGIRYPGIEAFFLEAHQTGEEKADTVAKAIQQTLRDIVPRQGRHQATHAHAELKIAAIFAAEAQGKRCAAILQVAAETAPDRPDDIAKARLRAKFSGTAGVCASLYQFSNNGVSEEARHALHRASKAFGKEIADKPLGDEYEAPEIYREMLLA